MIQLETEHLEVDVDERSGANIVRLARPGGTNRLAWIDSDWPIRASAGGSYDSPDHAWVSEHRGGWQEMFPTAGAGCKYGGIPHPVHGEVSLAPWQVMDRSGRHEVTLRSYTHTALMLTRTMRLDPERPRLELKEQIVNLSDAPIHYLWGHHPAFEAPPGTRLQVEGARFECEPSLATPEADLGPDCEGVWPRAESQGGAGVDVGLMPDHPAERVLYLTEMAETRAHILRPDTGDRLTLEWSSQAFPYAWVWINHRASRFPWFGRLSSMAVEPVNAWPADGLAAAISRGQAPTLPGNESRRAWLVVSLADDG
ncbi:MAG: hypothetical protein F4176_05955 [Acidimicrobiia bacterium]|nr:hypothetical protein [Acidimicrobiia bacterium]